MAQTPASASAQALATEYAETLAAVQAMQTGADQWVLADALLKEVAVGEPRHKFRAVNEAIVAAGMKAKGIDSLRFSRDTAAAWPPQTRIQGVSFTAHREVRSVDERVEILRALVAQYGAAKVTVARVNAELVARGLSERTTNVSKGTAGSGSTNGTASTKATAQAMDIHAALSAAPIEIIIGEVATRTGRSGTFVASIIGSDDGALKGATLTVLAALEQVKAAWDKAEKVAARMESPKAKRPATSPAKAAAAAPAKPKARRLGDVRGLS